MNHFRSKLFFTGFGILFLLFSCAGSRELPPFEKYSLIKPEREVIAENHYKAGNNHLLKNPQGIWELYVEGNPLERGISNGLLTQELIYKQESAFVSKIKELVPSEFYQKILRSFLKYFNRKLDDHVTDEYKIEIYGLSRYSSDEFNFVAEPYWRTLYFHAAHDIGHALQDLAMVGCTSFAAWGNHTADGQMLIGRNFDFYVGEEFAEEKMVAFFNPERGHKHAIVTWAGMIGAVSGMNEKGLTVTINAGKSSIPLKAKTPISLLSREILQYASNLEEAIEIAQKREVFVSEAIMIGSAEDRSAVLIEVSPKKFGVYRLESSADLLVCSNHFQSEVYKNDKKNLKTIEESHSKYRFERVSELFESHPKITPEIAAEFLRNKQGLNDLEIGYGNEKAINQLLAHHAVIFRPEERLMWVSANPYQLGEFVAYDLDEVFEKFNSNELKSSAAIDSLAIPEDEFVRSQAFRDYLLFKEKSALLTKTGTDEVVSDEEIRSFVQLNSEFWKAYFIAGEYYFNQKNYQKALQFYQIALTKEITTLPDKERIEKRIRKSERKLK